MGQESDEDSIAGECSFGAQEGPFFHCDNHGVWARWDGVHVVKCPVAADREAISKAIDDCLARHANSFAVRDCFYDGYRAGLRSAQTEIHRCDERQTREAGNA